MRENLGKWGKVEEILLSCPPGGATALSKIMNDVMNIHSTCGYKYLFQRRKKLALPATAKLKR